MKKHLNQASSYDDDQALGKDQDPMNAAANELVVEGTSKITSKGQISIPAKLMRTLGLKEGDRLHLVVENGGIRIEPIKLLTSDELFGMFKHPDGPHFLLDTDAEREARAAEIMRGGK
jgi:AbrB family looped-hinge helix DNA binding protein